MFSVSLGIGALIGGLAAAAASVYNSKKTQEANEVNIEAQNKINQENKNFTEEQNEITREREDMALQRKVNDAQAAGLSPLAAISGQGASASTPLNYTGQAGYVQPETMDWSGVTSMLESGMTEQGSIYQKHMEIKDNQDARDLQNTQFYDNLKSTEDLAQKQRENALKIADKQVAAKLVEIDNDYLKWSEQAKNTVGIANSELSYKAYQDTVQSYAQETKASIDYLRSIGVPPRVVRTNNWKKYLEGKQASINNINRATQSYLSYLNTLSPQEKAIVFAHANAYGNNKGKSLGLKLNTNVADGVGQGSAEGKKSASDWIRNSFGYGFGVDGSSQNGESSSSSQSLTFREMDKVLKASSFFKDVYVWQYVPDYHNNSPKYTPPKFSAKERYKGYMR